jgi:hypothetical protein
MRLCKIARKNNEYFLVPYAILLIMNRAFWSDWESFLTRWGIKPLTAVILNSARPILPVLGQLMMIGVPFLNVFSIGEQYTALVDTLNDEDEVRQFTQFIGGIEL